MKNYFLLVGLWSCFCIVHSLLISTTFTRWLRAKTGRYYSFYRIAYNLIAIITVIPLLVFTKSLNPQPLFEYMPLWNTLRFLALACLLTVVAAAFLIYDPLEFVGLRQAKTFFSGPALPDAHSGRIVKKGLLGIVRHPMYLATILFLWLQSTTLADILTSSILSVYILIGTVLEEKKLVAEYGQEYIDYQKQVPMLLPFPWKRIFIKTPPTPF